MRASDYFEFSEALPFGELFPAELAPWEWVSRIKPALEAFNFPSRGPEANRGLQIEGPVFIDPSVKLPPFGLIQGPAYIGPDCELRAGVYLRGNVIAGAGCVLGNSCEFKNCLLLDGAQVPHFSYVGDSILGRGAHLGAGVICSNLRLDQAPVAVRSEDGQSFDSKLRKLGALIGDYAEVGCNAVLNPGTVLGRRSLVMPGLSFRGTLGSRKIAYSKERISVSERRD